MVIFTKHAKEKFAVLQRHGIVVSEHQVIETMRHPELIDDSRMPLRIAQRTIDSRHVLRVVYKQAGRDNIIITFYPGRLKQYG